MSQDLSTLPKPLATPIVGNLADYSPDLLGFMTRYARESGEIVPIEFEGELFCLLTNPDHITEVLKDRVLFIKGKETQTLQGLLGNGLITSEGDFWQRQRRLTQPVFHQQRISSYGAVMVDYTQQMLQTWHDGEARNVHDDMMRLTLNIVMKTIFDRDMTDGEAGHIARILDESMDWFATPAAMDSLDEAETTPDRDRYQSAIELLDRTVYAILHQRRASRELKGDLLSMLMQVRDADDGSRMSDRQLRDEVASLMLAGHETTANTLSWTWMLLAQYPSVREKLAQELQIVLNGRIPTIEDLPQLAYASAIVKEAMRLYPPVTDMNREATQDCEIGGYLIPKGTTLIASQWVMHRDSRYFTNPEAFDPDRWANDLEKQLPRGVYFPFGDGPRICIGKGFAQMEAVLLLATIAQSFQLDLVPNQTIELQPSITLRPKHGIQVVLKKID